MEQRAQLHRNTLSRLGLKSDSLTLKMVDLKAKGWRSRAYGHNVIGYKKYTVGQLPTNDDLLKDLKLYCGFYNRIIDNISDSDPDMMSANGMEQKKLRVHKSYEGRINTQKVKDQLKIYTCQACKFNFEKKYGEIGKNYIEAHHRKPFSQLKEGEARDVNYAEDFYMLCSNCHRMIHKTENVGDLEAFKKLIK